ncbi:hypothetical protein AN396_14160 [Candidatus Epulonipiscium fishelsonii]|uniref:Uncharacterized protein n=1 Tax=Candidatus Epulonipiscium fishelsonii TaxID=77094 RepID=A0ACC8XGB2_9FIRM|nr:hypothetical protein AN396_14160 [Epulopiscium sp. SCG-B11WGA-EpuloA1]
MEADHENFLIKSWYIFRNETYILTDENKNKAVYIDPGAEPERIASHIKGFDLVAILITHGHYDHWSAVPALLEKFGTEVIS